LHPEAAAEVRTAGVGLVQAAPARPVQCMSDGVCLLLLIGEVEEPAYFGEGEVDKSSVDGWWRLGIRRFG
jgi:hypothetical protein